MTGGKSLRKSWNASDIEKVILRERKKRGTKLQKDKQDTKKLADAFG